MDSSLPLVAKCIHLFTFGFLGLATCSAHRRCSGKPRRMNEMEGSTLNGLSRDACHDAVVITVQKTGLKNHWARAERARCLGLWGLCLLIISALDQRKFLVSIFVPLP